MSISPHIMLILTDKCNLRCGYCYENTINNYSFMTSEVAFKAVTWGIKEILKKNINEIKIVFFGGEPLLNFDVLKETVVFTQTLSKQLGVKPEYFMVTNGLLIDKKVLSFASKYNIYFQLSLDGAKASNDFYRTNHKGQGSFKHLCRGYGLSAIKHHINLFSVNMVYAPIIFLIIFVF